jgi:hypothetical protein
VISAYVIGVRRYAFRDAAEDTFKHYLVAVQHENGILHRDGMTFQITVHAHQAARVGDVIGDKPIPLFRVTHAFSGRIQGRPARSEHWFAAIPVPRTQCDSGYWLG